MTPRKYHELPITWKISISSVAIHVYQSPPGLWVAAFGEPFPHEFVGRKRAMHKARQLSARYGLRILAESD